MQDGMDPFSFKGQLDTLNRAASILDEFIVTEAFSFLPINTLGITVFINRPGGVDVKTSSDVIVITCFEKMTGRFGFTALLFPARGRSGKFARDIDEFLNSPANLLKIAVHPWTTIAQDLS